MGKKTMKQKEKFSEIGKKTFVDFINPIEKKCTNGHNLNNSMKKSY